MAKSKSDINDQPEVEPIPESLPGQVQASPLSLGELSTSSSTSVLGESPRNPNDVFFEVTEENKHMPLGITVVSKECAEQFEGLGIGKVVKQPA